MIIKNYLNMRYLILYENEAFYSDYFMIDNNYESGMVVFDFMKDSFTCDGINWNQIEFNHL